MWLRATALKKLIRHPQIFSKQANTNHQSSNIKAKMPSGNRLVCNGASVTRKNRQMSTKVVQKLFQYKNGNLNTFRKMPKIWVN